MLWTWGCVLVRQPVLLHVKVLQAEVVEIAHQDVLQDAAHHVEVDVLLHVVQVVHQVAVLLVVAVVLLHAEVDVLQDVKANVHLLVVAVVLQDVLHHAGIIVQVPV